MTGGFINRGIQIPANIAFSDYYTSYSNLTVITTTGRTYNLIVSPR